MTSTSYLVESHDSPAEREAFPRVFIDGIPVFAGTREAAIGRVMDLAKSRAGARIATANLDFFALARRNERLRADLRDSSLVVADGMPVVWLAKLQGARATERLAGADLVAEFFRRDHGRQLRIAVYGSTAEVCGIAVAALHAEGEGARVVHIDNPPFRALTTSERSEAVAALQACAPDVVFVALGCPAQERWIAETAAELPEAAFVGIGGSLDFFAGVRKRAPQMAQRAGAEWLVRMVQEPRRLGKRYLLRDIPALVRIAPGCMIRRSSV